MLTHFCTNGEILLQVIVKTIYVKGGENPC